jgi:hypothetical protein
MDDIDQVSCHQGVSLPAGPDLRQVGRGIHADQLQTGLLQEREQQVRMDGLHVEDDRGGSVDLLKFQRGTQGVVQDFKTGECRQAGTHAFQDQGISV